MGKLKKKPELRLIEKAEEKSLENHREVKSFIDDFINSPAMQSTLKAIAEINRVQKKIFPEDNNILEKESKNFIIDTPLSLESKINLIIDKSLNEKFDKHFNSDKRKLEIKEKIAYCRFCGAIVMKIKDMSHFIMADMKCKNPKCQKIIRIPEDLNFRDK
jgi:hypothetical protein